MTLTIFLNYLQSTGIGLAEEKVQRKKYRDILAEYEQVQIAIHIEEEVDVEAQIKYRTRLVDLYIIK